MPPKMVKCSICNQTVLKAHTLALSDGTRGCREHPGVKAESGERLQEEKRIRQENINAPMKRFQERMARNDQAQRKFEEEMAERSRYIHSHCWVCDVEGIGLKEFFAEAIVAMKRLELRGEFNILTLWDDIRGLMPGIVPLWPVPRDREKDGYVERRIRDRRLRDIIDFLPFILLCPDCIQRFNLGKRADSIMPKPSMEDIQNIMPVVMIMEPEIKAIAERKEKQS